MSVIRSSSTHVLPLALAAGFLALSVVAHVRMSHQSLGQAGSEHDDPIPWPADLVRAFTFGFLPVGIDWLWMKSFMDPSVGPVKSGSHPPSYYYLKLVVQLDPAFLDAYLSGAAYLAVIRSDATGALDLLDRANRFRKEELPFYPADFQVRHWQLAWQVPLSLAYVRLFELGDLPRAAEYFREAAEIAGAPPYLGRLALRLNQPGGHYEVGLRLLDFMISGASDLKSAEILRQKRRSLEVARFLDKIQREFQKTPGMTFPSHDPWGGSLRLASDGTVTTSTPHQPVFGLK